MGRNWVVESETGKDVVVLRHVPKRDGRLLRMVGAVELKKRFDISRVVCVGVVRWSEERVVP